MLSTAAQPCPASAKLAWLCWEAQIPKTHPVALPLSPLRDPLSHSPAPSWELPCLLGAVASISHLVAHFIFTKPSEVSAISGLIFTDEDTEARRG